MPPLDRDLEFCRVLEFSNGSVKSVALDTTTRILEEARTSVDLRFPPSAMARPNGRLSLVHSPSTNDVVRCGATKQSIGSGDHFSNFGKLET